MNRRNLILAVSAMALIPAAKAFAEAGNLRAAAREAWLFTLPLLEMAHTRSQQATRPNTLAHVRTLATWESRRVTTPNSDTLYSSAWLDLTKGPLTLTLPPSGKRYQSAHIMNMYTETDAVLSPRSIGNHGGRFRLIGPNTAVKNKSDITISTSHGWMIVRTLVEGPKDLLAANQLQDGLKLSGPDCRPAPIYPSRNSSAQEVLAAAAALMVSDPPRAQNRAPLAWKKNLDMSQLSRLTPEQWGEVEQGILDAKATLQFLAAGSRYVQGWSYPNAALGKYDEGYAFRAVVSLVGLGALPVDEAMYMNPEGDTGKGEFRGDGPYRLRFPSPPPVDGFWSLTMYEVTEEKQKFLTRNALDRYAIGDRTPGLKRNSDGSLDIWISRTDPGGVRPANWLPAPSTGPYTMSLRAYLPRAELMDGRYRLLPIVPA